MKYIRLELQRIWHDFLRKMNVSSELKATKTDAIHKKVDDNRMRQNYLKLIPASLLMVFIELCGILYHLFSCSQPLLRISYVIIFSVMLDTTILILVCINRELARGGASQKTERISAGLFWVLCTVVLMICSYIEACDTGTFVQYLIYVLLLSLLPVFRPAFSIPYFLTSFVAQVCIMLWVNAPFPSIVFIFGVTVFCILASYIKYSDYMANHIAVEQLAQLAEYDTLTNLLNRRGMQKRAEILLDYTARVNAPLTIAILDIDFFKNYNDTYGHEQGDRCLQLVANCLSENYRRKTDVVCRYGGEEFLIIFVGEDARRSAENLLHLQKSIAKMGLKSGNPDFEKFVTVSIGAVTVQTQFDEVLHMHIKAADENLYRAKNEGRNRLCLNEKMYTI
ncbi:MAG: GGDEF domain-containing protein [Candidatus Fimenecus sp.]